MKKFLSILITSLLLVFFVSTDSFGAKVWKEMILQDCTTTSITFGTLSSDTVTFTGRLASQLYHNLYDQTYTVLKIHNHDTTAEIGGAEFKGELINTTGLNIGVAGYWSYEPTGLTGTPTAVSAGVNVMALETGHTITAGNFYALQGEAQIYGTLNGGTVNVAGVVGIISGAGYGANTLVLHMAGVQSAINDANPTTGTISHFLANTVGTAVIDNLLCMQASQRITNFASFNQAADGKSVEVSVATPAGDCTHAIRVLIAGVAGYIPVYAASDF